MGKMDWISTLNPKILSHVCHTGHLHVILKGNPFLSLSLFSSIFPSKNYLVLGQWNLGGNFFIINVFSLNSLVAKHLKL
jgi:hypothetical protein